MQKTSSEKNKLLRAVAIATVVLLCLGGFFVFCRKNSNSSQDAGSAKQNEITVFLPGESRNAEISVSARSAVLIEASSGEVIWSKNACSRMPMASTTKIMTALVALENCDISRQVKIAPSAVGVEGSSIYLSANEILTLEELLYAMLLESANDAAAAIAIEVGGSIEGFAELMNKRAADIGLVDTHFENPHGLDGDSHYTTAHELALIAREAYSNEAFRKIVSTHKKLIPLNGDTGTRVLVNHNKMLNLYEGADGIKTGYTKKSGRCLVSSAERDGLSFIAVTLNAPDDWNDHKTMLDLGFSLYEKRTLCDIGSFSYIMPVSGGACDHVMLENTQRLSVILPRGAGELKCVVELPRFSLAPIDRGDLLGRLVFYYGDRIIAESEIIAKSSVDAAKKKLLG